MDTVTRGSHCLELKQNGASLLHAIGTFPCGLHYLELNQVEQPLSLQMDTVTRGSHCFELKRSGTILLHRNGQRYACFALFPAEL